MRSASVLVVFALAFVLVGCSSAPTVYDRVSEQSNEILYVDVVGERMLSSDISFFGARLGDSLVSVRELHGEALFENEFSFGRTTNLEYGFDGVNDTVVLYHFQRGVLTSVLVTNLAEEFLLYDSLLGQPRSEMYAVLGLPTVSEDVHLERIFYYDSLGYEVYQREGVIDRVYFTTPNRGILPADRDVVRNESINVSDYVDVQDEEPGVVSETNRAPILCFEDECFS